MEKELNITDSEDEAENNNQQTAFTGKGSSIEEDIDDIEATLAKLKKELGL